MTDTPSERRMHVPSQNRVINASLPKWDEQGAGLPVGYAWLTFDGRILTLGGRPMMMEIPD